MNRFALLVAGGLSLTSCGLSADNTPTSITAPDVRGRPATTLVPAPGQPTARVYFFGENSEGIVRLTSSLRPVREPQGVLDELLEGPDAADRRRNLVTAIPAGSTGKVSVADGTATIDMDEQIFSSRGLQQARALAQIVFTMTTLEGIERVILLVDGQSKEWPRGDGRASAAPLVPTDYIEFDPTTQPDILPIPSPSTSTTNPPATTTPTSVTE